jgi:uncharacterized phage protein gp47/JayE
MRTIDEIYSEMAADYESESGLILHDGGDMSLRLHAVAAQVCAWKTGLNHLRQAFPKTAEGEYLDRHAPSGAAAGRERRLRRGDWSASPWMRLRTAISPVAAG